MLRVSPLWSSPSNLGNLLRHFTPYNQPWRNVPSFPLYRYHQECLQAGCENILKDDSKVARIFLYVNHRLDFTHDFHQLDLRRMEGFERIIDLDRTDSRMKHGFMFQLGTIFAR